MSADQRLGSDPLSWLKDKGRPGEAEGRPVELLGAQFSTPQDTIDEICASQESQPPSPVWQPAEILERLNLAICVYLPMGEVVYQNPAWQGITGGHPGEPGGFGHFFKDELDPQSGDPKPVPVTLSNGAPVWLTRFQFEAQTGRDAYCFATLSPRQPEALPADDMPAGVRDQQKPDQAAQNLGTLNQVAQWAQAGKESAGLIQSLAIARADTLVKAQLDQDELADLLSGCMNVLQEHFNTSQSGLILNSRIELDSLPRSQAVLVSVVFLEIMRLCLKEHEKPDPPKSVTCILSGRRGNALCLRLYADQNLRPKGLSFGGGSQKDFKFLAEVVRSQRGALLTYSGSKDEIRMILNQPQNTSHRESLNEQ